MHGSTAQSLAAVSAGLGVYYLILASMNWTATLLLWQRGPRKVYGRLLGLPITNIGLWFAVGSFFMVLSPLAFIGLPPAFSAGFKHAVNMASGPVTLTLGSLAALIILYATRRWWVIPGVAWTIFNLSLLAMGMAMTDKNFLDIVAKPDNVPIVALVYLLGYFTWLATYQAVQNDDRLERGLPPLEKENSEKVLVWPDLVYTEMICMVLLTAGLLVWAILLKAPLEEYASSAKTPNPSKAPWYFLGLQEMLVYYDPWMAGVVLPSLVIVGLMAIPYLDFNREGNGYYTIKQRRFGYVMFQLGFLELWIVLIVLGTFLRGPNWNFYGPFEYWDPHKLEKLDNINLSDIFWIKGLGMSLPKAPEGAGKVTQLFYILWRESPGIILTLAYLIITPPLLAMTVLRKFYIKMGFFRFMILTNLLLMMASLPLKMLARWVFNLKYIISIPEYFLNL